MTQGVAAHPGVLPARRAVPGRRCRSDPSGDGIFGLQSGRGCACCCVATLPALLFLPDLRAAREIQHAGAPAHRARHREALDATGIESQVQIGSNLARIHIVARTLPSAARVRTATPGAPGRRRVRSWADDFKAALLARFDEAYALKLFATYAQAFQPLTRRFSGDAAAFDVTFLEAADRERDRLHLDVYRPSAPQGQILSQDFPQPRRCDPDLRPSAMLENMDSR